MRNGTPWRGNPDGTVARVGGPGAGHAAAGLPGAMGPSPDHDPHPHTEMSMKFMIEISAAAPVVCRFCWSGLQLPARARILAKDHRGPRVRSGSTPIRSVSSPPRLLRPPEINGIVDDLSALGFQVLWRRFRLDLTCRRNSSSSSSTPASRA